jgi:probable HAF family extracellular repeat protein
VAVASVELSPELVVAASGGPGVQLLVVLRDSTGQEITGRRIDWKSSLVNVEVDSLGLVNVKPGLLTVDTAVIRAESGGQVGRATLIAIPELASFTFSDGVADEIQVLEGQAGQITTTARDIGGRLVPGLPTVWTSSDTGVVRVSAPAQMAIFRAVGVGEATITASLANDHLTVTVRVGPGIHYKVTPLGTLGGDSTVANDLNDLGQVVGWSQTASGERHAFLWKEGAMTDLCPANGRSEARGINNRGEAVGSCRDRSVLWKAAQQVNLGLSSTAAQAINDLGQIALLCEVPLCTTGRTTAARWENGVVIRAPELPESWRAVTGINEQGDVSGGAGSGSLSSAVVWRHDAVETVFGGRASAVVTALNDRGDLVGWGDLFSSTDGWFVGSHGLQDIPYLGSEYRPEVRPFDVNQHGFVVGTVGREDPRGFLWRSGGIYPDLSLQLATPEWLVLSASGINESGEIIGQARNMKSGVTGAVLLTPSE